MVEPEYSVFPGGDTTEKKSAPALAKDQRGERVHGSEMEEGFVESDVTGQKMEEMFKISDQIEVKALSFLDFSRQWDKIDYMRDLLKKKEEGLRVREIEIGLLEESISGRLGLIEEKQIESDLKLEWEASFMRLVFQKQIEQVVTQLETRENTLGLLRHSVTKTFNGLMSEFQGKKEEAQVLFDSINEKLRKVERAEEDLEAKKKDLSLLEVSIKEKSDELKRKEETFQLKKKEEAEKRRDETEMNGNDLDIKEKSEEEKMKELELKQINLEERSKQQLINEETRKRSHLELLNVENVDSLTRLTKKNKSQEGDLACAPFAAKKNCDANDVSTDFKPLMCPDTKFYDFSKSMCSFAVDQVWALHDPRDDMPRIYAQIRNIFSSQLSLQVTLLEHLKTTEDDTSALNSCGKFEYGDTEIKSHLMFVHEMYHIKCGDKVIVNPRKGETWALFRDWDITWNSNPDLHEPPYRYDFVEVISEFDDKQGIAVAYLGRVEGFLSVFNHAEQHGIVKIVISPEEMQRFSHKVESVELSGEEKEGVPDGSFELNPAATPSYIPGLGDCGKVSAIKDQDGSTNDRAIIID